MLGAGCSGTLGNGAVIGLSGSVVSGGKIIGGSITVVSNTIGTSLNYSTPGTNVGLSISVPLATSTNK